MTREVIKSNGTVAIADGELRVFNEKGEQIASIHPTREQWYMILALAVHELRFPS